MHYCIYELVYNILNFIDKQVLGKMRGRSILLISIIIMLSTLSKHLILAYILLVIDIILCLLRIVKRTRKICRLDYITICNGDLLFDVDAQKREDQLIDILCISASVIIMLYKNQIIPQSSNIAGMLLVSFIYFVSVSFSISYDYRIKRFSTCVIRKTITIFLSSIQGLFLLLILMVTGLSFVADLLPKIQNLTASSTTSLSNSQNTTTGIINPLLNSQYIVTLCYIFNTSVVEIVVLSTISVLLLQILIIFTPPYQLTDLSKSFKIANILIAFMGVAFYFYANWIWPSAQSFAQSTANVGSEMSLQSKEMTSFIEYLKSFSKGEITNLGYLLFLPYTFGAVIFNFLLDLSKNRYQKKSQSVLEEMINSDPVEQEKNINLKKFIFYGGERFMFDLISKIL